MLFSFVSPLPSYHLIRFRPVCDITDDDFIIIDSSHFRIKDVFFVNVVGCLDLEVVGLFSSIIFK